MSKFDELFTLNVNDKVEKRKNGSVELSYLSWAWAWAKFKSVYPDAKYEIKKFETVVGFENGNEVRTELPYMQDPLTGYMVQTSITADGLTYEMWLPVMDSANKAMKNKSYEYKTKSGIKTVEAATMFDVNKTIMRCLVKNMAMFGLGLYIYAGEDLPDSIEEQNTDKGIPEEAIIKTDLANDIEMCKTEEDLKKLYKKNKTTITGDKRLLDLITKKANEIRKVA